MDFNVSLRRAIKTGEVTLGRNKTQTCIQKGTAQLVILANNCPESFKKNVEEKKDLPLFVFGGSSMALGRACGKPFMVSALAVTNPGDSDILKLTGS
ncbi:MAG: 50S ribosomal protein L30e [Methanomicrobiales archaeon]|nr:50S ribosomal protein L30e [Methanomicrobiales archaeon]